MEHKGHVKRRQPSCTALVGGLGRIDSSHDSTTSVSSAGMGVFVLQEEEIHYKGEVRNYLVFTLPLVPTLQLSRLANMDDRCKCFM